MASRNLTDAFTRIRAQTRGRSSSGSFAATPHSGGKALLDDDGLPHAESHIVKNMLPPAWVDSVDEVERHLTDIDTKIEQLRELHRKRLMVSFAEDGTEQAQDEQIERTAKAITTIFRRAEKTLKTITNQTEFTSSDAETKLRANVVRTLASRVQQASVTFRRTQKDFLNKRAEQKKSSEGFDFLSDAEAGTRQPELVNLDTAESGLTMEQMAVVNDMEREIAQRDREIANLVESIEELSQIFKELAVLVIDQGTILDRIDYNMEQVVEKVEDGVQALEKAEQYQKSARPRYCILALITIIAILLTLLILKHTDNKKNKDDD